eukprot:scaffold164758_cov35-Cyclotella_meneghiniana.AAC.1
MLDVDGVMFGYRKKNSYLLCHIAHVAIWICACGHVEFAWKFGSVEGVVITTNEVEGEWLAVVRVVVIWVIKVVISE